MLAIPGRKPVTKTVSNVVDYSVTSTTFVPLTGAMVGVFVPGDKTLTVSFAVSHNGMAVGDFGYVDVMVDGKRQGGADGLAQRGPEVSSGQGVLTYSFTKRLRAGLHVFQLMARVAGGTGRFGLMYWGTGHTEMTVSDASVSPIRTSLFGIGKAVRTVPSYDSVILATPGLVNYWKLDEASAAARVDAVAGLSLAVTGSITKRSSLIANQPNGSAISTASAGALIAGSNMTWPATPSVECWFILGATLGNNGLLGAWNGSAQGAMLAWGGTNELRWYTSNTYLLVGTMTVGTLYHVVATFDGTNRRAYINGVLVAGPTAGSTPQASPGLGFQISGYQGAQFLHNGSIGNVANYNVPLSGADALAHYTAGITT